MDERRLDWIISKALLIFFMQNYQPTLYLRRKNSIRQHCGNFIRRMNVNLIFQHPPALGMA